MWPGHVFPLHKYSGLDGFDLQLVGRVGAPPSVTADNIDYLRTKFRYEPWASRPSVDRPANEVWRSVGGHVLSPAKLVKGTGFSAGARR
jgi:hypothetical protein